MTGVGAAINTARVTPGATVAVIGCGGVGVNVIQGARLAGAAVIVAVDRMPGKLDVAAKFGATHAVRDDALAGAVAELTGGAGFDYVFEVVGRSATIRLAWDSTRRGGTTVVVGAGSRTDLVSFSAGELFSSEKKLLGCLYGSADVRTDFARLLRLWQAAAGPDRAGFPAHHAGRGQRRLRRDGGGRGRPQRDRVLRPLPGPAAVSGRRRAAGASAASPGARRSSATGRAGQRPAASWGPARARPGPAPTTARAAVAG